MHEGLQRRGDCGSNGFVKVYIVEAFGNKYKLSPTAGKALLESFTSLTRAKTENFSNARLTRKLFERVRMKQALRTKSNIINDSDIKSVLAEKDIATMFGGNGRKTIGFSA